MRKILTILCLMSIVNCAGQTVPPPDKEEDGGKVETGTTELYICGDNMVYLINPDMVGENGYKDAVLWSYDLKTAASTMGVPEANCIRLDECKSVDGGTKLLLTSSNDYCLLLDVESTEILFWATNADNAHSAELLPGGRIVVACSTGGDRLQLYDIDKPNEIISSIPLTFAHGAVWNEATQRLYAIGYDDICIYELADWDTTSPFLIPERTVKTPQNRNHDLTYVDDNTLCLSGHKAYLYDITNDSFTEITRFRSCASVKAMNYNGRTREVWYTDATKAEGTFGWSTQTIRYSEGGSNSPLSRSIKVPDLNMYKVRVRNW